MQFHDFSDEALLQRTHELVKRERELTLEILHHLREVERRRLFAGAGYPSLFEYCVKELGYSEPAAQRRIASMRLLREMPELEEKISGGTLTLSVVAQAQSFFRKEEKTLEEKREVMTALEGKSARAAERELASRASDPTHVYHERARPVSATHSEVRFLADEELLAEIEELRGLLAHSHPGMGLGDAIRHSVKLALQKHRPKPPEAESPPTSEVETRAPSRPMKREVWHRDGGSCTWTHPETGKRCGSRHGLQYDHVRPWAQGGPTAAENLRLLCFQHNQWESRFAGRFG